MTNIMKFAAAAMVGAIAAFGISAEAAQFSSNGGGGGGGVSRSEFERLQGQVQAIEGRVTALEHMSGRSSHNGASNSTGHKSNSGQDNWNTSH